MKINHKILSLPPYISTSWRNVSSLRIDMDEEMEQILIVELHSGATIEIPGLSATVVEEIFSAHEKYLEQENSITPTKPKKPKDNAPQRAESSFSFGGPLKFGTDGISGIDNIGSMMQHNPEQANMPDLPPEIIQKISTITKAIGMDEAADTLPKAEPHCNCMYCQIARAVHGENLIVSSHTDEEVEEEITDEDLTFREWDINQENEKLYIVSNPLDKEEHYQVFLGKPIGCTCGEKNCEHIRAVLNS